MEFRRSKLSDEDVTPDTEYRKAAQVIATSRPDRAYASQKQGPRAAVCTQEQWHFKSVEFERAISENGTTRFRNRLHVHQTASDNAAPFQIGPRGWMVPRPIVEAAEESPSRRHKMIALHLQYPTATKATRRKGYGPEVARRETSRRFRNEGI